MTESSKDREIVSARTLEAPPAEVWAAFAEPARLAQWWGPNGFTNTIHAFDLRPGGTFHLLMRGPDGVEYDNRKRFVEVTPGRRVAYDHLQPMHVFRMTMEFEPAGAGTRLTWRMVFESAAELTRLRTLLAAANEENFDRLAAHLDATKARTGPDDDDAGLRQQVQSTLHQFLDHFEAVRPELYRYCRHLTRCPWDAEDLVQDTLARAFVTLGCMFQRVDQPRAWLFRIASNLWIDQTRRARPEAWSGEEPAAPEATAMSRDAAATLLQRLSPQERAAVVLADVFDFTLAEVAAALTTTVGAIKAALHRARTRLAEPPMTERPAAIPAVIDDFCAAFAARDLPRLTSLLLDTATVDVVGVSTFYGPDAAKAVFFGMLFGAERMSGKDPRGGMEAQHRHGVHPTSPRLEVRTLLGEVLLLHWHPHDDGEYVRAITRLQAAGDRLARVRNYFYTPDFIGDVARELGVPSHGNGYRYW